MNGLEVEPTTLNRFDNGLDWFPSSLVSFFDSATGCDEDTVADGEFSLYHRATDDSTAQLRWSRTWSIDVEGASHIHQCLFLLTVFRGRDCLFNRLNQDVQIDIMVSRDWDDRRVICDGS